jgi:hypothetical protein
VFQGYNDLQSDLDTLEIFMEEEYYPCVGKGDVEDLPYLEDTIECFVDGIKHG